MIVEIDSATMKLRILKYVVVHDCGTVINPLIVAGQIQGGIAQGIGNAFYERLAFDEQGQLINGTLTDYLSRPHRKCRRSKSSTTSRPHRTTSWASRGWVRPVPFL
jgi:carbon-monoxide dehydrogenase large subunit